MVNGAQKSTHFDKDVFYAAMSSKSIEKINNVLTMLQSGSVAENDAFEGALLMKKAGLVQTAKEKLHLFKTGRKKLDATIKSNSDNAEYRFLRVMIQENAPKVVNYKSELVADCSLIQKMYKKLNESLQQIIIRYSKNSKYLIIKEQ